MPFNRELVAELNLLTHFDLSTTQVGIKVHHTATDDTILAATRLFEKGIVTQPDGGYLTSMGRGVAEHAQVALKLLDADEITT